MAQKCPKMGHFCAKMAHFGPFWRLWRQKSLRMVIFCAKRIKSYYATVLFGVKDAKIPSTVASLLASKMTPKNALFGAKMAKMVILAPGRLFHMQILVPKSHLGAGLVFGAKMTILAPIQKSRRLFPPLDGAAPVWRSTPFFKLLARRLNRKRGVDFFKTPTWRHMPFLKSRRLFPGLDGVLAVWRRPPLLQTPSSAAKDEVTRRLF